MTPTAYRRARLELGLTQAQLAKAVGVSRKCINRREAGDDRHPITREAWLALMALAVKKP